MKGIGLVSAFLGGAIVGCATAMLFAPEKGSDLRSKIQDILTRKGIDFTDDEVEACI